MRVTVTIVPLEVLTEYSWHSHDAQSYQKIIFNGQNYFPVSEPRSKVYGNLPTHFCGCTTERCVPFPVSNREKLRYIVIYILRAYDPPRNNFRRSKLFFMRASYEASASNLSWNARARLKKGSTIQAFSLSGREKVRYIAIDIPCPHDPTRNNFFFWRSKLFPSTRKPQAST